MKFYIHYLIVLFVSVFSLEQANAQCTALYTFDMEGVNVDFTDLSSTTTGTITSWFWDFGDGTTSTLQNPSHTFPSVDDFDVCLTITTSTGCSDQICSEVEPCDLSVSLNIGSCDSNGDVELNITIFDAFDNAKEVDVFIDGNILPGSPFDIDDDAPVFITTTIPGDGLSHTLLVLSNEIGGCEEEVIFNVPDCGSNCFLSGLGVNFQGGATHTVQVDGDFFAPQNVTIEAGDVVHFLWVDGGHSTTSDATSGPDSWNSGVIGIGSTYDVTITNPGVHPYYCIPHGGPGGTGMAGTIVANCPAGNNFTIDITFNTTIADPAGFNLLIDGVVQPGSPFSYNGTGPQLVTLNIAGDGLTHLIEIEDINDPTCIISTNFDAPDCGAAPSCSLSLTAVENGACDASDNVPVDLSINSINGGAAGFNVTVDGVTVPGSPFAYDPSGVTQLTINVAGDGQNHTIVATDVNESTCTASASITTTNCTIPCQLSNLVASTGSAVTHTVLVEDFVFTPANITISDGDIIEWSWTGVVDHTTTSDATAGADSWDSGLLGQGATYLSPVLSTGVHPYYCIPHGAPGGTGMAGTITVQANCTNGEVSVLITFDEQGGSFNGFNVIVDGTNVGTFSYDPSGTTSVSVNVTGDGQSHSITVQDTDNAGCSINTNFTTPDCNAPTCQLTMSAQENGGCDGNDNVPVDVTVNDVGGGASGFNVIVDGSNAGTFSYSGTGTTTVTVDVSGNGANHTIEVIDIDEPTCSASTSITTTNCTIPCQLSNLVASTGSAVTHTVLVEDFVFTPANITISDGDIIEWDWTGVVEHTTTSDATAGADSWDSGLLGQGATFLSPVLSAGVHPYYCIPHGAPGGVGMAGTITVQPNCTGGNVSVLISFEETGGGFGGFDVFVDGSNIGNYAYDPSGTTSISIDVIGDGQSHSITIQDSGDAACSISTSITTPDCNAPTCQLTVSAQENGGCDGNDNVPVDVTVNDVGGGASGFNVIVDGTNVGTFSYSGTGTTTVTVDVAGDGASHTIEVIDVDEVSCVATTTVTTTNCVIPCQLSNLNASTGSSVTHTVLVEDFVFTPANITIADGDIIEWDWTGVVEHTTTSDATAGADSWDSGLLEQGATFLSPVLSAGVHPYYCIPHGAPGGVGMAGTITVQPNCTGGNVSVLISFEETGGGFGGFDVFVDGSNIGNFAYDPSGTTSISIDVIGDGQSHSITIQDTGDAACSINTSITTPDCNAPTCQLTVSAQENGGCDGNDNVPVDVTVNDVGGGANGFNVIVDGTNVGTFSYSGTGTTVVTVDVAGDGVSHTIEVVDIDEPTCSATTSMTTTNCVIPCQLSNINASTGSSVTHTVLVEDFVFTPANITIADGDIIEWDWTGVVEHTTTSDATAGADSWDSGLLGQGATFLSPVLSAGVHPYYCIPHGAPGGVGMAGTITVQPNCTGGNVSVLISFEETGGSFGGFDVFVDGSNIGNYAYDPSGTTSISIDVIGDGQSHSITIQDTGDAACSINTSITTPDCNAPTCQLTVSAQENGGCDGNDNVPVDVTVNDVGGGANGFNVIVDGSNAGTFSYSGTGTTVVTVDVAGDGASHTIEVIDVDEVSCAATTTVTTTNCVIPCQLSNINASTGSSVTHTVLVEDFVFTPANITIADGDIIEWDWTGVVEHTTTSDATAGADSWDSGLLGQGATFLSPVLSAGVHPYYCIPHGAPGGVGMAGTITVQPNCTGGNVSVLISFEETGGGFGGFDVFVDGSNIGNFAYDPSGTTSISIDVIGDGQSHSITIQDSGDAACSISTSITTPDCNAPTCQLTVSAQENGGCDSNDNVPVDVTVNDVGGGASGFNVIVDGTNVGTFSYSGTGTTTVTVDVSGDGASHTIEVIDVDEVSCAATTTVTTTNCVIPCQLSNLNASTGSSVTHTVLVEDFVFTPANITIADGDIIEWDWTGVVEHTTTSDATAGADSWDSGLLGQGATFLSPVLSAGVHPYYCIPHGAPGGVGMAGTITVQPNCTGGNVSVLISFEETGGGFGGFDVFVDGSNIGNYAYDPSGTTSISIDVIGDGQSHSITIQDTGDAACSISTSITTPDCNAPTCQLTASAQENGGCDGNDNVPVDVTVNDVGGGANGFNVIVDGTNMGTFSYSGTGTTVVTVDVSGDGASHTIEVVDVDEVSCAATTTVTTTNCVIPCQLSNINASTGSSVTHTVLVEDFVFTPANITIADGDIIEWDWTGVVEHTTTSDATAGADSWDSGLLGQGATFLSPVLSAGVHPYYCIPHGAPGGVGMAGTITVQPNCTGGNVSVLISFEETGGGFGGFDVFVDGSNIGNYAYDPSGTTSISIDVIGDGQSHSITIQDSGDAACSISTSITTPDCNAPTCQLTASAQENGGCDGNDNVPVDVTVNDVGGGANGFNVIVDGTNVGTFSYSGTGTTTVTVDVAGDGASHTIEVIDVDEMSCAATTSVTTTNCVIPCQLSNINASTGSSVTHTVLVEDFVFTPANITIADGDIIEWDWTGVVEHTTTSDATAGADSWDSGLLGQGATFLSPVLSAGVHPYYCIPHGAPGGVGMAGTITVQPNCTGGNVSVLISFEETGGGFGGFDVFVDGANIGNYAYDPSGTTSISIDVIGDGQSHSITIQDTGDAACSISTSITTPDCNAPTCQLTASAQENGGCDGNDNVPVDVTVNDVGGGANGFNVIVDGTNVGTFSYSGTGTTTVTVDVAGDGASHTIEVIDVDEVSCAATTTVTTTNCVIPCQLSNLNASTGSSVTHTVLVEDFVFSPANITIADGDIIEWDWTGVVEHTTTSDATAGADSWDSGLLGQGATFLSPVLSAGVHPYYCIPHGAPGGVGMAGTITVQPNCTGGNVSVLISFEETGGGFGGFDVFVDGANIGNYAYDPSGTTSISIDVIGDGQSHSITIQDTGDAACSISTSITTPDCNAPTCQLTASAQENGGCDGNDNVPVDVTVNDVGGGANGFNVIVDGTNVGTFSYSGTGTTTVTVDVAGDGASHTIEVIDVDEVSCAATTTVTTTNCVIPCQLSNINASTGSSVTHTVLVEDFVFTPANITIADGDIIEWDWTGVVEHTTTSDATAGADSWDSGLLGQGATFLSPVLSAGVHPYYCIPHGAPGGVGMAGTITVQPNCTGGNVSVLISFEETGGGFGGFDVFVDGSNIGNYAYDPSGTTSISIDVIGDGQSHSITIQDSGDAACSISTSITTPDCNAPTCQLTVSAQENGGCDGNDNVPVDVTVNDVGGGANGFNVIVDGTNVGTFSYSGTGTTTVTVDVAGDGTSHTIEVIDVDEVSCVATTTVTTTNCVIPCQLSNLNASTGSSVTHTVLVEDFVFTPANITIADGDIIEWDWTGVVEHTTTSDATAGADSWDSGLLGQGATFLSPVLSAGVHPYYCIPHGAPGGVGMAGTITVQPNCTGGNVSVLISFEETGGGFGGFDVFVDGSNIGNYAYDPSGTTSISIDVIGDGQSHSITIQDTGDAACSISTSITTPDCNAPTCQLTVSAQENGGCDGNDNVPVDVTVNDVGGGANGFNVIVDGTNVGTFSYSGTGTTTVTVDVSGDGASHTIEVVDVDELSCAATTTVTTTNCVIPCQLSNINASTGSSVTHTVLVEDFVFSPANITIADGDIIEWDWTGVVEHTTTSDATAGADSWDSGLLGQGATFLSPVLSAGVHSYYCIPHGAPGGVGMAGTITVQPNCTGGNVSVLISFEETGGGFGGFDVFVDGANIGNYAYDPSGTTSISIDVIGDGQSHSITIQDSGDAACSISTSITTPDCNAPTCQLTASAQENGGCDGNDNVPVDVTVNDVGGGASGFNVIVDGSNAGTFSYSGTGTTVVTVDVAGDGASHTIEVIDVDEVSCAATTTVTTTNCVIPCQLSNLNASTGSSVTHTVLVEDFVFTPANITIADGDIIEWDWTGVVEHTTTSDATAGADSWDSGLLGQGATFLSPVLSAGVHPYYCIPHGAPGGVGMAGTITVQPNCTGGNVSVLISFEETGGGFGGFDVFVDGANIGNYAYDPSGTTSISIDVIGDGQSHSITIQDSGDAACSISTSITTPDCNAPTCQLTVNAQENGGCDGNDNVPVDVTVNDVGGGANGFNVIVDGTNVGTFSYSGTGTTTVTVDVSGDGASHTIEVVDVDEVSCAATTTVTTTNCVIPCQLSNITLSDASGGTPTTHVVYVDDFVFTPSDITVTVGDIVRFEWTGVVAHTTTSDASSGLDVWDSDLLGQGATYEVTIQTAGQHPYYCIPHGAPGGIGMAGVITAVPPCDNNDVAITVAFESINGSSNGYNVFIDGQLYAGSPFNYNGSGSNQIIVNVPGDGLQHTIEIVDLDESTCSISESIITPDCGTATSCELTLESSTTGTCDSLNQVAVVLDVSHMGNSSAFNVFVDGNLHPEAPFSYSSNNNTQLSINLAGNNSDRVIEIIDVDSINCSAVDTIFTPLCGAICEVTNLAVEGFTSHIVEVKDFVFEPAYIDVLVGDTVRFVWTGVIAHTTTSDLTSGVSSWDSGLLGQGATYDVVITESGSHPYYCIPHGGPGGIGMAGLINAIENCENGNASMSLSFNITNGSPLGYNVFLDGNLIAGPILYDDPTGYNSTLITVPGDNTTHLITIQDLEVPFCAATTQFTTPFCDVLCEIQNLEALSGEDITHVVEVKDFEFDPLEVSIHAGETIQFVWTGDIPHTATTDVVSGANSWDSGLLGNGAEYNQVIENEGVHPYYCIPHGGPGGIGMAGVIHATANCENDSVAVEINFNVTSGSSNGYHVFVDGNPIPQNPISYDDPTGANSYQLILPGDGATHLITVQDDEVSFCAATTTVEVIDCNAVCAISELSASVNAPVTHLVDVLDFDFAPQNLNINLGDTVKFIWTGAIPHTTTSDLISGVDSWDSGLLEQGDEYILVLETEGVHPYYCIPHGGPGGIGMAGTITVVNENCQNGIVSTTLSFNNANGSGTGYDIYIDGSLDVNGPFAYDDTGSNQLVIDFPGDGANHQIIIADHDDVFCADTITIELPNCNTDCQLEAELDLVADCDTAGLLTYALNVFSQNVGTGFNLTVDGNLLSGSPFGYAANDSTTVIVTLPGDATSHTFLIEDTDSLQCNYSLEIVTPDCTSECVLDLSIVQTGNCDVNGMLPFNILVNADNPGATGFNLFLDGVEFGANPFSYDGALTTVAALLPGDGQTHELIVQDVAEPNCSDTLTLTTINCSEECNLFNLIIEMGVPRVHTIDVEDFVFAPEYQVIEALDTVRWVWTGDIPHTATSDSTTGPDVWNSGLLGQGAVYDYVIQSTGLHPYYCIPHGAPGGVGMAGTIEAEDPIADTMLFVQISFEASNIGINGYQVLVDNEVMGTWPYHPSGFNSVIVEVPADGMLHEFMIQDLDIMDCLRDTIIQTPDYADPCFGFNAEFDANIDHQTFEADFISLANGAISWSWTFGDGGVSSLENPSYTYAEDGTYEICLTAEDAEGCVAESCDSILIGAYLCQANFSYANTGLTVSLTDQSLTSEDITNWEWTFGNGFSVSGIQNPEYTYDTLGIYEICLTITAGACVDDTCVVVDFSDPCVIFQGDFIYTPGANGLDVQFTDTSSDGASQWLWGFGDGNTSNEQHPMHTYASPGIYTVCLLVQDTVENCNFATCREVNIQTTSLVNPPNKNVILNIYPNPVTNNQVIWTAVGIQQEDIGQLMPLKIYDTHGKTIVESEVTGSQGMQIRAEQIAVAGVYFLEIRGNSYVYRAKVVVQ